MISLNVYKLVHILGILLTFTAVGGLSLHAMNGGSRATNAGRRFVTMSFGIGLFLILLGGFGMLARLGIVQMGLPAFIWVKLAIWLAIGGLLAVPYRKPELARAVWLGAVTLGIVAAWVGLYKPF